MTHFNVTVCTVVGGAAFCKYDRQEEPLKRIINICHRCKLYNLHQNNTSRPLGYHFYTYLENKNRFFFFYHNIQLLPGEKKNTYFFHVLYNSTTWT